MSSRSFLRFLHTQSSINWPTWGRCEDTLLRSQAVVSMELALTASFMMGLGWRGAASYRAGSWSASASRELGQSAGYGCASSMLEYCGGKRQRLKKKAWVHKGGTETIEHVPKMSSTQKPGHITKGITQRCRHIGTLVTAKHPPHHHELKDVIAYMTCFE